MCCPDTIIVLYLVKNSHGKNVEIKMSVYKNLQVQKCANKKMSTYRKSQRKIWPRLERKNISEKLFSTIV